MYVAQVFLSTLVMKACYNIILKMPAMSKERMAAITALRPAIDALNGQGLQLKDNAWILKARGIPQPRDRPLRIEDVPLPPDDLFIEAEGLLRRKLTEWVEGWLAERRSPTADPGERTADYLSNHPELNSIIGKLAKQAPEDILRILLGVTRLRFQVAFTVPDDPILTAECEALRLFVLLLRSELSIGKCALPRCQRYYVNASGESSKRCCTRKHAAALAIEGRRARQHAASIARAARAIDEWDCKEPTQDWKRWVAERTQLTSNFITRGVNSGELQAPKSAP